ncbi:MAG: DUF1149 family protein [Streptococcaceae bacterium]|nr:DUF1149 family protein [Streptococcaceae bacterium]MCL2681450.1 DUF1149 family protein [Streptococcaceae bacterium]MCL2858871.1 DUF1149 family protein [Streptococcaceae bacterium]
MTLNIEREQVLVNQFHYDARNLEWEKENGTPETDLNVQLQVAHNDEIAKKITTDDTALQSRLTYIIVLDDLIISGFISQLNIVKGKKINSQEELTQEDMQVLAEPLLDVLKRLVYDTTEITLDKPGIDLAF